MYDVTIVGAGPAGSYLAGKLAVRGHQVLVIEQHERAGEAVCCTGILGKECLEAFPIDRGIVLREARAARLFPPSGTALRLSKESTQAYIVDRASYDIFWATQAQEAGAEYLWGSKVKDIAIRERSASATVTRGQEEKSLESKAIVIASGFGSGLPQKLGLGRIGDFVMGAQAEVETTALEEVEVYFGRNIAPDFFAWLAPTSPGKALAGLLTHHHTGTYLKAFLAGLHAQGKIATPEVKINYGGIPLRPLPRTYTERVIVVGDAAGQVKPTSAGGIYYGLLCARAAAETLHQALSSDDFSATMLAAYEKEWKRMLGREIKVGRWARRLFERLTDEQIDQMFRIVESRGIQEAVLNSDDFSFDWHAGLVMKVLKQLGLPGAMQMSRALLFGKLFGV